MILHRLQTGTKIEMVQIYGPNGNGKLCTSESYSIPRPPPLDSPRPFTGRKQFLRRSKHIESAILTFAKLQKPVVVTINAGAITVTIPTVTRGRCQ